MLLPDLHDVPCLFHLELIFMLVFLYFDNDSRLLFLFLLSQGMIISSHYSFPWFRFRFLFNDLFFEHLHHFLLLLPLLPLLHHCHSCRFFAFFGFMYFLEVFLYLQLLHFPFKQLLVLLGVLFIESFLAPLFSPLCVHTVLVLLLCLHDALLSLLFLGLVISALFEFFELILQILIIFDDNGIVEAGVGVVNVAHWLKSGYFCCYSQFRLLLHLAFVINALLFTVLLSSFPSNHLFLASNNPLPLNLFDSLFNLLFLFYQLPFFIQCLLSSSPSRLLIPYGFILGFQLLPESSLLGILSISHGLALSLNFQLSKHLQLLNLLLLSEVLLVSSLLLHPLLLDLLLLESLLQEQPWGLLLLISHHLHSLLSVLHLHFLLVPLLILSRAQHYWRLSWNQGLLSERVVGLVPVEGARNDRRIVHTALSHCGVRNYHF